MTPDFQRKKKFLDLIAPSAHGVKGQLSPGKPIPFMPQLTLRTKPLRLKR